MRTDALSNFAAACARQERMQVHLRETCRKHDSHSLLRHPVPASPFGSTQEVPSEWQGTPPAPASRGRR